MNQKVAHMDRQWLVNHSHRKAPDEGEMTHAAFDTWRKHVGDIIPSGGDYEDFTEDVFRFHAAVTSFGRDNVWVHHQWGPHRGFAFHAVTGERRPAEELRADGAGVYGMQPNTNYSHAIISDPADDYASLKSFRKHAGRYVETGGFNSSDESDFANIFTSMQGRGIRNAILKRRHHKYPLMDVDLGIWKASGSVLEAIGDEDLSWSLINNEGLPHAYLVQERVRMRYEYRSFVVGHQLVTGAGCVEENTPLNNSQIPFDDVLREYRDQDSTVERLPEVRDAIVEFSMRVAADIALEAPEIGSYTLDTALGDDGEPLVIELNGHLNAGFYASNPVLITDALLRETETRP